MQQIIRLVIAFAVFFAQSSIGLAVGVCPPELHQTSIAQESIACPMGMKTCCACCKAPSGKAQTLRGKALARCSFAATNGKQTVALAGYVQAPLVAILAEPRLTFPPTSVEGLALDSHLAVPRIRPPNPSLHGLRAPPTR